MVDGIDVIGQADDSSSAMRMISEQNPALVLLDTNLPDKGTYSILKRVKANGSTSRYLVLADSVRERRDAYSAGADAALIKGFCTAKLIELVKSLLSQEAGTLGSDFGGA
jgi:two-component system nitrate/nitrite response regulator NarL